MLKISPYWMYLNHEDYGYRVNLYKAGILNVIKTALNKWSSLESKNGVYYPEKEVNDFCLPENVRKK